jgi:HK97 family phage portal protein
MGFFSRFLRASPDQRALTGSAAIPKNSEGYGSESGVFVSEQTALQAVTVYACVKLLADNIASLPMDAYRKVDGLSVEVSPVPSVVRRPFSDLTVFEWLSQTVTSLALRGNAYLLVVARDTMEFATELMPLHPDLVQVRPDRDTGRPVYSVDGKTVPRADIVHIRRLAVPGALVGLSPIEQARQSIGLGLAAERYGARWFGQSADPSAVLSTDQELTGEQAERNMAAWIDTHGGKRHPAMLSGGLKYQRISITPEESQFLETRKFQRGEIAQLFGIPPHMIGDVDRSTSWGTGIEQQSIGWVRFHLRPWLTCIEQAMTDQLPRGQFVRFNVEGLLRGDTKARYDAYVSARNAGWMNVNEIRELEDRGPVPGGDSYIQPLNMGPLGSDPLAAKEGTNEDVQDQPE